MRDWIKNPGRGAIAAFKCVLFLACLLPLAHMSWGFFNDELGANPVEAITRGTGEWTLRFLLASLAITPLRKLSGMNWLLRTRRMLGLYAFFYGLQHFITYIWLDQFFDWEGIARDIVKRPFITVGFAAFVLLIPLAATSFNTAIRLLGGRRWQTLHRSVYAIGILAVLHYWWLVKRDITEPLIYTLILATLLGYRAWMREEERRRQLAAGRPQQKVKARKIIPIIPR
ncbi:sulfite oxidase heme-binding subunit YedZ [Uliginosibacterium sp. 31-12]|uniref:sulfite oxidase heme-binding subunit YedZ n=1 Tax=Uliginosibacterium sp. 31-12 TaxID=3062781 RepID=UPI0026E1AE73|nr:protein-methionine-sulfoxide reductase heme-binding subunit MsrQ [Uliginosibacterium sp. 31-12]MDO6385077.1 protein-methionine-sulfoxide reductase heme-binding subunit MsrQ [Uliginosibacterium sp. 31-12]